jgi:hypothetical protein
VSGTVLPGTARVAAPWPPGVPDGHGAPPAARRTCPVVVASGPRVPVTAQAARLRLVRRDRHPFKQLAQQASQPAAGREGEPPAERSAAPGAVAGERREENTQQRHDLSLMEPVVNAVASSVSGQAGASP